MTGTPYGCGSSIFRAKMPPQKFKRGSTCSWSSGSLSQSARNLAYGSKSVKELLRAEDKKSSWLPRCNMVTRQTCSSNHFRWALVSPLRMRSAGDAELALTIRRSGNLHLPRSKGRMVFIMRISTVHQTSLWRSPNGQSSTYMPVSVVATEVKTIVELEGTVKNANERVEITTVKKK
jgi:hypothetical protein